MNSQQYRKQQEDLLQAYKERNTLKDSSSEGKIDYLLYHIFFSCLLSLDLYWIMCGYVKYGRWMQNPRMLLFSVVVTSCVGLLITFEKRRTLGGIFANIFCGMGLYTFLIYIRLIPIHLCVYAGIVGVITVAGVCKVMGRRIMNVDRRELIVKKRLLRSFLLLRKNCAVASLALLVLAPLFCKTIYKDNNALLDHYRYFSPQDCMIEETYGEKYSLQENLDTIKLIRKEETWKDLPLEKKHDVITACVYRQAKQLGVPFELNVQFKNDSDYSLWGYFSEKDKTIYFNDNNIRYCKALEALDVVLHETRHAFQFAMCDVYKQISKKQRALECFEGVNDWSNNFSYYVDGRTEADYINYLNQPLEVDAREYSKSHIPTFYEEIDHLLEAQ